ncbi:MAG: YggS family pyridoxal phosphate-dependent enzyme [Chloroflexota bacterium]
MEAGPGPLDIITDHDFAPVSPAAVAEIAAARDRIQERIEQACRRSRRETVDVRMIAVSKTIAADRLRAAVSVGIDTFGENRVQEAADKVGLVPGATWHLIGPLQSNKARRAIEMFGVIQSVDSLSLASKLDRISEELRPGRRFPVLLQVNVDEDPAKAGIAPAEIASLLPEILGLPHLQVGGLMTVGRLHRDSTEARSTFSGLRHLSDDLRARQPGLGPDLSMGMSDDFEIAVEEGATIVRIGRILFGARSLGAG